MLQHIDETYTRAARESVSNLCCPTSYDPRYLKVIPNEVIERDYGCGDPTPYVRAGETVLDLGSGSGKMCFVLAQIVGTAGRVIGFDANPEMLKLARRAVPVVANRLGYGNVEFRRAALEDIDLDIEQIEGRLSACPVGTIADLRDLDEYKSWLRDSRPTIADRSVDVVVSNCVLNLVPATQRRALLHSIWRKLKPGGRIAIADIVCDGALPAVLANDPALNAACVAGAFQIEEFIGALVESGFIGVRVSELGPSWRSEAGVAFRSMTLTGSRPVRVEDAPSHVYAIYRGPWKRVEDEYGRVYQRGDRFCLCTEEGRALLQQPYACEVTIWNGANADLEAAAWTQAMQAWQSFDERGAAAGGSPASSAPCCPSTRSPAQEHSSPCRG